VACSAAIGATALSLPSPDRSTDRVSILADWAFSLRPPPLFRPPDPLPELASLSRAGVELALNQAGPRSVG
jgi:hypothetical protein